MFWNTVIIRLIFFLQKKKKKKESHHEAAAFKERVHGWLVKELHYCLFSYRSDEL